MQEAQDEVHFAHYEILIFYDHITQYRLSNELSHLIETTSKLPVMYKNVARGKLMILFCNWMSHSLTSHNFYDLQQHTKGQI